LTGSRPRVEVIGVAPGAGSLPEGAREAALACSLLVGARRHLALLPEFRGEVLGMEGAVAEAVERAARSPEPAALLASGDPGFYGIAASLLRVVPRDEVRIWPAVSSVQFAFARAGEPWSDARFGSLHGRGLEGLAPLLGSPRIGLLTDARNDPSVVARFLVETGWGDLAMLVAEDLGLPTERLARGRPADFVAWRGSDLNVVLLLREGADPRPLGPGLPDDSFAHARGLITKAEVRAAVLSALRVPRAGVFWDVGAGSGSVSVEACLLSPGLRAFAVEKTPEALAHLAENRRRFRVAGLTCVRGEAPEALATLPDPDAVFVGGSGGRLREILSAVWARLLPGGRCVAAAVLLETAAEALAWARSEGAAAEVVQLQASRGRTLAGGRHLLEPQNAVTLVACTKREA
jgi:precorrin-6B C5,15-methyltransferase / cobalt-precorrin-6B C5,C15-methyltransferase